MIVGETAGLEDYRTRLGDAAATDVIEVHERKSSDMIATEVEKVVNLFERSAFPNRWLPLHCPPVPIFWSAGQAQRFLSAHAILAVSLCAIVLAAQMLCRIGSQVRTGLSAGGKWIRTFGSGQEV
jgi:hypothetical protein